MGKEVEISLCGGGYEIVQSQFSDDEIKLIKEWANKKGEDMVSAFLYGIGEILEDRTDWFECDELGHFYGGDLGCKIYLTHPDGEMETFYIEDAEIDSKEEIYAMTVTGTTVSCVSCEKGTIKLGTVELEDNEKFDIKKLKLIVSEVMCPDSYYELVTDWSYDNKTIDDEGPADTTGKGFEVEID